MSVKRRASVDGRSVPGTIVRRRARKSTRTSAVSEADDRAHEEILIEELNAVHGELGRVDNKSSMLLGFAAGGLLLASAVPPAGVGGWIYNLGIGLAAASIVPLLAVVRPRLGRGGFTHHAQRTPAEIQAELSKVNPRTWRCEQLIALSRIAVRKFKLLRLAAGLQTLALVVAGAGVLLVML